MWLLWEQECYKSFTAVTLAVKAAVRNGHPAVTEMAKIQPFSKVQLLQELKVL